MASALILLLLGLFPALFLPALQSIVLVVLMDLIWRARSITRADLRGVLSWSNLAVWQFLLFFLINATVFTLLPGAWEHVRAVALESWAGTLVASGLLMLWLQLQEPSALKAALLRWLPVGLALSFGIASWFYVFSYPGERIHIFAPSPLIPPLWFLIFALLSFCWFSQMSRLQQMIRLALFAMAGIMIVYAAARLMMMAWIASALLLALYALAASPARVRARRFMFLLGAVLCALGGVITADYMASGVMLERFANMQDVRSDPSRWPAELPRMLLWPAAQEIISNNWLWGIGQVNERIALRTLLEWDHWYRAHQTYLSYLIAGGVPALISGLLYQLPILQVLRRKHLAAMFPAFIGLGVVLSMNAFTDSLFQSAVAVQAYMIASLITLRAAHG
jgi:hypothetical protein